ncbi:MAG: YbaB/EbfC family nucleoid-associated protein [Planctomycetes bacterium]|nr:YbaB/EbfC family nucleoid-associated protein [Planctomycetota bacterium]
MARGGNFGGFDMNKLARMTQDLQKNVSKMQDELKERVVEADAGSGMVKVQVNGHRELLSIKIAPDIVDKSDVAMLEDLVLVAVQNGMTKAKEMADTEMNKVTGGMGMPGLGI